jgi:NTP-dependent ternary system trypsin peptidase co-occuring protein
VCDLEGLLSCQVISDDSGMSLAECHNCGPAELIRAQKEGEGDDIRFTVGTVEMEFAVDVKKRAGTGISVNVLSLIFLGGKGDVSRAEINRVKIVLNPHTIDRQPIEVAKASKGRPGG